MSDSDGGGYRRDERGKAREARGGDLNVRWRKPSDSNDQTNKRRYLSLSRTHAHARTKPHAHTAHFYYSTSEKRKEQGVVVVGLEQRTVVAQQRE